MRQITISLGTLESKVVQANVGWGRELLPEVIRAFGWRLA